MEKQELVLVKASIGNVLHNGVLYTPGDKQTFTLTKDDELVLNKIVKVVGTPKAVDLKKEEEEKANLKSLVQIKDEELKQKDSEIESMKLRLLALEKALKSQSENESDSKDEKSIPEKKAGKK